ncbi:hypothetical protein [Caballeronia sp. LZ035]|uniref:hypothetical protein n=1 Tax=Caballeronia sp. LZ035 TaxID=3038568 RepID=UPI00285C3C99|nr:hypothetical protein [Caballeronia sp. LZ035]MDR5757015.1 hypothetical protein [Caballeronia sp. LZ035]
MLGLPSTAAVAPSAAARAEEDEDRKKRDDESDDEYAKRMEEKDKDEEAKKAEQEEKDKASRADDDSDDADAEADEKDDKEEGKRAGRAKGARQRERARCAAIVAEGFKIGRVKQACVFAFDTKMSVAEAISALSIDADERPSSAAVQEAPAASRRASLYENMANARPANPGNSAPAAAEPDAADLILAASKSRRGEK